MSNLRAKFRCAKWKVVSGGSSELSSSTQYSFIRWNTISTCLSSRPLIASSERLSIYRKSGGESFLPTTMAGSARKRAVTFKMRVADEKDFYGIH